jgi:hypothetical protein
LMVLGLVVLPATKLILVFNLDFCHSIVLKPGED